MRLQRRHSPDATARCRGDQGAGCSWIPQVMHPVCTPDACSLQEVDSEVVVTRRRLVASHPVRSHILPSPGQENCMPHGWTVNGYVPPAPYPTPADSSSKMHTCCERNPAGHASAEGYQMPSCSVQDDADDDVFYDARDDDGLFAAVWRDPAPWSDPLSVAPVNSVAPSPQAFGRRDPCVRRLAFTPALHREDTRQSAGSDAIDCGCCGLDDERAQRKNSTFASSPSPAPLMPIPNSRRGRCAPCLVRKSREGCIVSI
eukprot:gnl/TRDRNA2_/TRDRNA2_194751_c0_seq1.p1 gnl/TRDRNA2_/TRDRNA2_194751_c0~~gnl/TRDRNA2_/TRDRNA2_194751_c0_seq1.p1  ORF type:complete len:258 (+),score=16.66 gnl/TRDRNA2_/TRDRNA2_194751_c0_seq1:100-873(+)